MLVKGQEGGEQEVGNCEKEGESTDKVTERRERRGGGGEKKKMTARQRIRRRHEDHVSV